MIAVYYAPYENDDWDLDPLMFLIKLESGPKDDWLNEFWKKIKEEDYYPNPGSSILLIENDSLISETFIGL